MSRPTRATAAGQAYLDLQNRARLEGRGTQELMTLYVVERWLARLSASPYADQFIIKGGMLLAAYDARRPTADLDTLARSVANDETAVLARVAEIARLAPRVDDGVMYRAETATARVIRDQALYAGIRIAMDCQIATATVKFRLDVNFGDPVTPAPSIVTVPPLRPVLEPVRVLGYPIETVLAEKLSTAITLGPVNTRVRDYADIYTLTGSHIVAHDTARAALLATAAFRGTELVPLSASIDNIVGLRRQTYVAYRAALGAAGEHLPDDFALVVAEAVAFADRLTEAAPTGTMWNPQRRRWTGKSGD
jgi:Nucleotidyl transferase AbiEii toxin, Type IV TA system